MNFKDKRKEKGSQNFPHANWLSYKWNRKQVNTLKNTRDHLSHPRNDDYEVPPTS